jgi:hypothetical protein
VIVQLGRTATFRVAHRDAQGTVAGAIYDPNHDELCCARRDGPASLIAAGGASQCADPASGHFSWTP